ncbi:RHS repeat-associated core domain-containing protein [Psychrobacter sp. I-STPA6b]|uniref:RHS repeat-associated core domain-containing protein n=1 Tax=Psychrobacter sp. I-STPA6b TaxID=2585718 RepID=UPI001D0CB9E6|nr:RHS repeat-associated core domain-containing protein [Psychrobacter sp. I-STPA6b]
MGNGCPKRKAQGYARATWVDQSGAFGTDYKFTGKELDKETGLYYFDARYYDPRTQVWQSPDPILSDYLGGIKTNPSKLPGMGGVYNPPNLNLYAYSHNNPVNVVDLDGKESTYYDSSIERAERAAGLSYASLSNTPRNNNNGMSNKQCVLNGGGCNFIVSQGAGYRGLEPWYEIASFSPVLDYNSTIEQAASVYKLDPDLIRAIMYMETTHGYYDKVTGLIRPNKSILPMNINVSYWGDSFGSREYLENPHHNIFAGTKMLASIKANIPDGNIAQIATLYNNVNATQVSEYGARVARIYSNRVWEKEDE